MSENQKTLCAMKEISDCGGDVLMEDSRTQYHYEGEKGAEGDPNKDIPLCRLHAKEHHEHWNEMWADYHSGLI